ncbi:hypothetical protein FR992_27755, partial [Serratia marcescens]
LRLSGVLCFNRLRCLNLLQPKRYGKQRPFWRRYRVLSPPAIGLLSCFKFRGLKDGLAVRGIVTANAVTLFESSLRCGGLRRVAPPCPSRA